MELNLKNKNVFISGGTDGIGLACVKKFASLGANVITFSRSDKKIQNLRKLKKNFNIHVFKADALEDESIIKLINVTLLKFKRIDILINNVGGGGSWGNRSFVNTNLKTWSEVFRKNNNPLILFTQKFLSGMKKNKYGRVITISSILAEEYIMNSRPWYSSAKNSQIVFMKNFSKNHNFSKNNITFNSISPGPLKSKTKNYSKKWIEKNIPANRLCNLNDIVNLILFISSDYSSFINGINIKIDGGQSNSL